MTKTYTRKKSKFKTARSAWSDIAQKTGLKPSQVKNAGHTSTTWKWKKKQ